LAWRCGRPRIGSVIGLLGLDLAVPDHSTLSRRAKTLEMPSLRRTASGSLHMLVDSTGLKLGGAGEWLVEKHGTSCRRSWRKLHIGVDADSGEIAAVAVTKKDIDDAAMAGALLGQIADPITSFTADGTYDQDQVSQVIDERYPDAVVIVPPRAGAVASASAGTAPTQRDRHLRMIAERGRMAWQKASGYNLRAKVEATIGRYKRVIGDALRSRTDQTEATDQDPDSTGCGMAFISWLLSTEYTLGQIAQATVALGDAGTLAQLYGNLSGDDPANAWPNFSAAIAGVAVTSDDPFGSVFPA